MASGNPKDRKEEPMKHRTKQSTKDLIGVLLLTLVVYAVILLLAHCDALPSHHNQGGTNAFKKE